MRTPEEMQDLLNRPRTKSERRRVVCAFLLVGAIFLTVVTLLGFTLAGAVLRAISNFTE
jgi:hypothetical protein